MGWISIGRCSAAHGPEAIHKPVRFLRARTRFDHLPQMRFGRRSVFLALILAGLFTQPAGIIAQPADPIATTSTGQLRGRSFGEGAVFKGIPYAQPPVGALRWKAPVDPLPWTGVRDAGEFGAPCAQTAQGYNNETAKLGREDCLYLNVWTPEWPVKTPHAVIVWVHGGGNTAGTGGRDSFDRQTLSKQGIVLVTINYRVGALGFFAHPELTAESGHGSSGNYGLLDQIAALRWVRQNIAGFGGDPENVTIAGQSAGAIDLGLLMTSPQAAGLFTRAIAESGAVMVYEKLTPKLDAAELAGTQFAKKLNAPEKNSMAYLRSLSAEQIVRASQGVAADPNVDGWVIPEMPAKVYLEGREQRIPLLIGNNGREHVFAGSEKDLNAAIEKSFGARAAAAIDLYKEAESKERWYAPYGSAGDAYSTDTSFRCAVIGIAQWHRKAGNPVFQYEFTVGPLERGARHSDEIDYVFVGAAGRSTPELKRVGESMQSYWTNFAKSGNPSGAGTLSWPEYDDVTKAYMEFSNNGPVVKRKLRQPYCHLLLNGFTEKLSQAAKSE